MSKQVVHAVDAYERTVPSVYTVRNGIGEVVLLCTRYSANNGNVSYELRSEKNSCNMNKKMNSMQQESLLFENRPSTIAITKVHN